MSSLPGMQGKPRLLPLSSPIPADFAAFLGFFRASLPLHHRPAASLLITLLTQNKAQAALSSPITSAPHSPLLSPSRHLRPTHQGPAPSPTGSVPLAGKSSRLLTAQHPSSLARGPSSRQASWLLPARVVGDRSGTPRSRLRGSVCVPGLDSPDGTRGWASPHGWGRAAPGSKRCTAAPSP